MSDDDFAGAPARHEVAVEAREAAPNLIVRAPTRDDLAGVVARVVARAFARLEQTSDVLEAPRIVTEGEGVST
jgi:hypothetical protein